MTVEQFNQSLLLKDPFDDLSVYLKALWFDAKGDWNKSHSIIQDIDDVTASWIHAYLHRKEGDTENADYWYRRAGKKRPAITLNEEWENLVNILIGHIY
jgi:hypothetical protein